MSVIKDPPCGLALGPATRVSGLSGTQISLSAITISTAP